jgi:CheY-like chemotaxis protein
MLDRLREQFLDEFLASARRRVALALERLATGRPDDIREAARELHSLGGEAGLIALPEVHEAARAGEEIALRLAQQDSPQQRIACARALRVVVRTVEAVARGRGREDARGASVVAPDITARRRAVVIDDSPLSASLLAEALEQAGLEVRQVSDDLNAVLRVVAEFSPDLVLTDLQMPNCDARQLRPRIQELSARPPKVLAVSAMTVDEMGPDTLACFDGVITKHHGLPPVVREVLAVISGDAE